MDENNQPSSGNFATHPGTVMSPEPAVQPAGNAKEPISRKQDIYETLMLIFGIATLISLLTNQGALLKISTAIFLGVAVFAIVRNTSSSKFATQQSARSGDTVNKPKKPRSPLKVLGISLLVLLALPVLGYAVLILILLIFLSFGGGNMGT